MRFQHFSKVPEETSQSSAIHSIEISLYPFKRTASAKAAAAREGGICSAHKDKSSETSAIFVDKAKTMANSERFNGSFDKGCAM
jgi:hypothetical protein